MDYSGEALEIATRVIEQKQKNLIYRGFEHTGMQTTHLGSESFSLKVYRGVEYAGDSITYHYRHSNHPKLIKVYRGFQYN